MQWAIASVVLLGLLAWGWRTEREAEANATAFCESVTVGGAFADVVESARTAGEDRLRSIRDDSVLVGYTGIPPFSRHACAVTGERGRVVRKSYLHLD